MTITHRRMGDVLVQGPKGYGFGELIGFHQGIYLLNQNRRNFQ
jgi:hypothetical protein